MTDDRDDGSGRGRRSLPLRLLAGALVVLGAGVVVLGSVTSGGGPPVVGGNRPINVGATDQLDITSHNSPTAARSPIDPDHLVVVDRVDTPRFSCALHVSDNAGVTWTDSEIPFPAGEDDPPRCYAPDVAFGSDGALYLSFVTLRGLGNTPNAAWVVSSDDGGRTLSVPVRVAERFPFQVRLTAHPTLARRLYLSWLQADATGLYALPNLANPIVVARSDDGGDTWSEPVRVSPASRARVVAPSTVVGPGGDLYLVYLDLKDDRLDYHGGHLGEGGDAYSGTFSMVVARSGDDGATWEETTVDEGIVPSERFVVFLPPTPSIAVDGRRVYVAFHDSSKGDADVWFWASDDGAVSFSGRRRVNDTPVGDGTSQYLARIAVAPNGRVDVAYYDRRAGPGNVMNAVSLQSSTDAGRRFGPHMTLSDTAFDSRVGYGSERGLPDLGSRLGLVSGDDRVLAAWSDTRAGSTVSQKQDLAIAVVALPATTGPNRLLQVAGALLAVIGLALLVMGLRPGAAGTTHT